jgi:hypothetical protein
MKVSSIIYFFLLMGLNGVAFAQNEAILEPEMLYRKSFQYGGNLNSTGLGGINFKYGWQKTGTQKHILDVELARVRHYKETRIYGASENPQQYTYGRLNMAFFLRTGLGRCIKITERPYKNAVGVNFNYSLGLTTAILKPVYLDVQHVYSDNTSRYYVTSEQANPDDPEQAQQNILGNASFFDGFSGIFLKAGGYGKCSISAEWGQYPDEFHTLEAGFTMDYFPSPLPLMAYVPENHFFFILFVGYSFGLNK